jgi:arginase
LAFLTGLDKDVRLNFIESKLDFSNLLYIGIRDIDPIEKEFIEKYDIKWISVEDLNKRTHLTIKRVKDFIDNKPVHISFDVDSLDPNIFGETGTPVPRGLELKPTKEVLDSLLLENIVNMDITEINLDLGEKNKNIPNLKYLFSNYFFASSKL